MGETFQNLIRYRGRDGIAMGLFPEDRLTVRSANMGRMAKDKLYYRDGQRDDSGEEFVSAKQIAAFAAAYKLARSAYFAALEEHTKKAGSGRYRSKDSEKKAAERLAKLKKKWEEALFDFDNQANQSGDEAGFYRRYGVER